MLPYQKTGELDREQSLQFLVSVMLCKTHIADVESIDGVFRSCFQVIEIQVEHISPTNFVVYSY